MAVGVSKQLFICRCATYVLFVAFIVTAFLLYSTQQKIVSNGQNLYHSNILANELRQTSADLTRFARSYAVTGDEVFRRHYCEILDIRNGKIPRPYQLGQIYWDAQHPHDALSKNDYGTASLRSLMVKQGLTTSELRLLNDAEDLSNALVVIEEISIRAILNTLTREDELLRNLEETNSEMATRLLFSDEYHLARVAIMMPIQEFLKLLSTRTQKDFLESSEYAEVLNVLLFVFFCLMGLLTLRVAQLDRLKNINEGQLIAIKNHELADIDQKKIRCGGGQPC